MKKISSHLGWTVASCLLAQPLVAQEPTLRFVLDGHTRVIQSIAVTDDTIVSGSVDRTVKLWDLNTGVERMTLEGHEGRVFNVVVSPDGRTVASAGDGTIRLWNAATGQEEMIMEPGLDPVATGSAPLAFTPDGQTLASSDRGTIRFWNVVTGEERANLTLSPEAICCTLSVAFVADGSSAVSKIPGIFVRQGSETPGSPGAANRQGFVLWDLINNQHRLVEGPPGTERERVLSIAVTTDEQAVATGGGGGVLRLWDVATGTSRSLEGHALRVWEVTFSPDGKTLASASWDGTVRLWDVDTGELQAVLGGLPRFYSVAFSRDGKKLVAAGGDGGGPQDRLGQIIVWDLD